MKNSLKSLSHIYIIMCIGSTAIAQTIPTLENAVYGGLVKTQYASSVNWMEDGEHYSKIEYNESNRRPEIVTYSAKDQSKEVLIPYNMLIDKASGKSLSISSWTLSPDNEKVLIFTNTRRVWRYHTRGDYWILNRKSGILYQLGKELAESSLCKQKQHLC